MLLFYNLLFPFIFLLFFPGLIIKLIRRPGHKENYLERFGIFSKNKAQNLLKFNASSWVHAVSVGETVVATSFINELLIKHPNEKIVLSTTTTTGQELAQKNFANNPNVKIIFCPIDFYFFVKKALSLVNPNKLIIFETEIWPNLIHLAYKKDIPIFMVNARMSDKSFRGYKKIEKIISGILNKISKICVQSEIDLTRFKELTPKENCYLTGNMKFDQQVPKDLTPIDYREYFGKDYKTIILAASTHPNEEEFILDSYTKLQEAYPTELKLVLVPRHAERGDSIEQLLIKRETNYIRKTKQTEKKEADILLADTTGEMLKLMASADIVIMGKTLAGHNEGHNLIEPALLSKPIITGRKLTNFRVITDILRDAIIQIETNDELYNSIKELHINPEKKESLGALSNRTILKHSGAIKKNINAIFPE